MLRLLHEHRWWRTTSNKFRPMAFVLAMGFLLPAAAARGECLYRYSSTGPFCNGCQYEVSLTMDRDGTCVHERPPQQQEFLGDRIIRRAQHGIAGVNGSTTAYRPNKGFVGTDEFTYSVKFRQGSETGTFIAHWTIVVH
jgi:hypothetical protein